MCMMPVHKRKDVSVDLKQVILSTVKAGMSYRKIAGITRLSVGAIAGIVKVCSIRILGGGQSCVIFVYLRNVI